MVFPNRTTSLVPGGALAAPAKMSQFAAVSQAVLTDPFQATVTVLPGLGGGAFQTERTALLGTSPVALAAGDFNNDGQKDVVSANFASNDVSVLLGNGSGGFGTATNYTMGTNPSSVVVGDFNRDGTLDAVTAT